MNTTDNSEEVYLTDFDIFKGVLFKPRDTYNFLVGQNYQKWVLILILLGGISGVLGDTSSEGYGDNLPIYGVILVSIIMGVLFGWLGYYLYALMLSWTGSWLKGEADSDRLLLVIAYAQIPIIFTIVLFILQLCIYQSSEFTYDEIVQLELGQRSLLIVLIALELILSVWSMVLAVIGVSVAQDFSILKSILNLILPSIVVGIPIILGVILFKTYF